MDLKIYIFSESRNISISSMGIIYFWIWENILYFYGNIYKYIQNNWKFLVSDPLCLLCIHVVSLLTKLDPKPIKWLLRKYHKIPLKKHENWPFSSQIFSQKTKSYEKWMAAVWKNTCCRIPGNTFMFHYNP